MYLASGRASFQILIRSSMGRLPNEVDFGSLEIWVVAVRKVRCVLVVDEARGIVAMWAAKYSKMAAKASRRRWLKVLASEGEIRVRRNVKRAFVSIGFIGEILMVDCVEMGSEAWWF
jgi:hypothetical protein